MPGSRTFAVNVEGAEYLVEVAYAEGVCRVRMGDGPWRRADLVRTGESFSLLLDAQSYSGRVEGTAEAGSVWLDGDCFPVRVQDPRLAARGGPSANRAAAMDGEFRTPMPGLVVGVAVSAGESVAPGQCLVTLEAMKMRNDLKSPRTGVIREVLVVPGLTVAKGDVLVRFEA